MTSHMDVHLIPNERDLFIYGAGDHGLVVAEAATEAGWRVRGFLDDKAPTTLVGKWRVLEAVPSDADGNNVIVAIGDNMARRRISADLVQTGLSLANVIHPAACVSRSAILGRGIFIGPQAVVNGQAAIQDGAIINSAAVVEHHCVVEGYSHICPGAVLCGHVHIGSMVTVGAGASVIPKMIIGDGCVIGAGAVVISNIEKNQTAVGVPAFPLHKEPEIDLHLAL